MLTFVALGLREQFLAGIRTPLDSNSVFLYQDGSVKIHINSSSARFRDVEQNLPPVLHNIFSFGIMYYELLTLKEFNYSPQTLSSQLQKAHEELEGHPIGPRLFDLCTDLVCLFNYFHRTFNFRRLFTSES